MSIATKNLWFTVINILLLGVILTASSYWIQGQVLLSQLHKDSQNALRVWANDLKSEDVIQASKDPDRSSDIQQALTAQMDVISKYNPNIAQAYVFGTELENGNLTSILIQPSRILDHMDSVGLELGDMLEQPERIVKGIKEVMETGGDVVTPAYSDTVGTWVTALSPIRDENGKIFAYLGMDIDATMIHVGQVKLFSLALSIMTVLLMASIIIQVFMNKRTFSPVNALVAAIDEVSVGNYTVTLKEGTDELGRVNSRFNVMTSRISSLMDTVKRTASQLAQHSEHLVKLAETSNSTSVKINRHVNMMSEIVTTQGTATLEIAECLDEVASGVEDIVEALGNIFSMSEKANYLANTSYASMRDSLDKWEQYKKSPELSLSIMKDVCAKISQSIVLVEDMLETKENADMEKLHVLLAEVQDLSGVESERMTERLVAWDIKIEESRISVETGGAVASLLMSILDSIREVSASTNLRAVELEEIHSLVQQYSEAASYNGENARGIAVNTSEQHMIFQKVVFSSEDLKNLATELDGILHDIQNK